LLVSMPVTPHIGVLVVEAEAADFEAALIRQGSETSP